jgi:hypothetical protein
MSLVDNLVSYWKFQNNSYDSVGINNGVDTSITYNSGNGKIGNGAGFNGSTSKVLVKAHVSQNLNKLTIGIWFKSSTVAEMTLLDKPTTSPASSPYSVYILKTDSSGFARGWVSIGGTRYIVNGSTNFCDGNWHYMSLKYDGSNVTLKVDNTLQQTTAASGTLDTSTADLYIGQGGNSGSPAVWNGAIDEINMYNTNIASGDETTLYNAGAGNQVPFGIQSVQYLIIAGGGGGGQTGQSAGPGGGGGGGLVPGICPISPGTYAVVVGAGGNTGYPGSNGSNSSFNSITATGGGYGNSSTLYSPGNGGSGGGGSSSFGGAGTGTAGQGYDGGSATGAAGGGGGGAGAIGQSAPGFQTPGNGGDGLQSAISGTLTYYAGGGGGYSSNSGTAANGGQGGGGNGLVNGTANTGGGGGASGNGGSGVVILSYPTGLISATGGTMTTSGGMTIHTFTSNGNFVVASAATNGAFLLNLL